MNSQSFLWDGCTIALQAGRNSPIMRYRVSKKQSEVYSSLCQMFASKAMVPNHVACIIAVSINDLRNTDHHLAMFGRILVNPSSPLYHPALSFNDAQWSSPLAESYLITVVEVAKKQNEPRTVLLRHLVQTQSLGAKVELHLKSLLSMFESPNGHCVLPL